MLTPSALLIAPRLKSFPYGCCACATRPQSVAAWGCLRGAQSTRRRPTGGRGDLPGSHQSQLADVLQITEPSFALVFAQNWSNGVHIWRVRRSKFRSQRREVGTWHVSQLLVQIHFGIARMSGHPTQSTSNPGHSVQSMWRTSSCSSCRTETSHRVTDGNKISIGIVKSRAPRATSFTPVWPMT